METQRGGLLSTRWGAVEAATGAAFSVIALLAFLLALGPSDTSGEGVFRYYPSEPANRD